MIYGYFFNFHQYAKKKTHEVRPGKQNAYYPVLRSCQILMKYVNYFNCLL